MIFSSLKRKFKKGFTLVELIVVIAIIAILAAVSVVSYIAFINQANQSSDEQAITQINLVLQAQEAKDGKPSTIVEMYSLLNENGLEAKAYKPLYKDRYFFWDSSLNRVLYTDASNKVLYPAALTSTKKVQGKWFSLSGEIAKKDYQVVNGVVTIGSDADAAAGQLVKALEDAKTNTNITSVTLTGTIDVMGADISCNGSAINTFGGTIGSPATIVGAVSTEAHEKFIPRATGDKSYASGMFIGIKNNLTIQNLIIENASFGDYSTGNTAIFVDTVSVSGINVTFNNVTVKDSKVRGLTKSGVFVGQVSSGLVTINNCTLENVNVSTTEGEAGLLCGAVYSEGDVVVKGKDPVNATSSVELYKDGKHHYVDFSSKTTDLDCYFKGNQRTLKGGLATFFNTSENRVLVCAQEYRTGKDESDTIKTTSETLEVAKTRIASLGKYASISDLAINDVGDVLIANDEVTLNGKRCIVRSSLYPLNKITLGTNGTNFRT